jgi:uncharacterized membrane protein
MPLERNQKPVIQADWTFKEIDWELRWFQFLDRSYGDIQTWEWDFGDGNRSNAQNPSHKYDKAGEWTVILTVKGPDGISVRSKVWDIVTK